MAANFGFVPHPAQRLADELAPGRLGNRLAQAGLANPRRPDEAQDRSLQLVGPGLDGEVLDNPVLDLFQRIVVRIQDRLGGRNIALQLGLLAPRQAQQHVQVVADHGRFGAHRLHRAQLFEFRIGLGAGLLRQLQAIDLFLQLLQFINLTGIVTAQFLLDRLELFVEVIFALGLLHLALHAPTDATFHLQHAQLAFHEGMRHFHPLERVALAQHRLLVGHLGLDMGGHGIGQLRCLGNLTQVFTGVLGQLLVELGIFGKGIDDRAHHRLGFVPACAGLIERFDTCDSHFARCGRFQPQVLDPGPLACFNQNPHRAVGQLEQLQDGRDYADVIQIIAIGIVTAGIKLREQEDVLVPRHRRFQRSNRLFASHEQRNDHPGEHDNIAQRQQGEQLHVAIHL